jgi:hypothetical protein
MKTRNTYSFIEYQKQYGTEEACERALFKLKWSNGYICSECDSISRIIH